MQPDQIVIPASVATRAHSLGEAGVEWLGRLPDIVGACVQRWSLELEGPFAELWFNYVAPGRQGDTPVAIKVCCPGHETTEEVAALRFFDGRKCVRLLDFDAVHEALLLERALPGSMIETLDDGAAISEAARVMLALWRPAPAGIAFPRVVDWLEAALQPDALIGMKGRYPWVLSVLAKAVEMAAHPSQDVLLHGDLHQGNILSAQRERWLAIDPKGIIGEAAWDVAPFLWNSLKKEAPPDRTWLVRRRADQFCDELSMEREWLYAWCAASALHNAFWSLRDVAGETRNWQAAMACAEALAPGP